MNATSLRARRHRLPERGAPHPVSLLDLDAEFRDAVPPADRRVAERALIVARHRIPDGPWEPDTLLDTDHAPPVALLVVRGVVVQEVVVRERASAHLIGPGEAFRPSRPSGSTLPYVTRWRAAAGVEVAVLDGRFLIAAGRWPTLLAVFYRRLADQIDAAIERTAICSMPRIEDRVLALFWHLADRWGVVRPEGVVIRLGLTHELIGHLTAGKRPTVSLALSSLGEAGRLVRGGSGQWILSHESLRDLEPGRPSDLGRVVPISTAARDGQRP